MDVSGDKGQSSADADVTDFEWLEEDSDPEESKSADMVLDISSDLSGMEVEWAKETEKAEAKPAESEKTRKTNSTKGPRRPMFHWHQEETEELLLSEDESPRRKEPKTEAVVLSSDDDDFYDVPAEPTKRRHLVEHEEPEDQVKPEEPEEPKVKPSYSLTIQGIKVEMPVKPYPCQEQVITSIISGCNTQQNCLLESPTGSGKTLALLCGALGWQSDFQRKSDEAKRLDEKRGLDEDRRLYETGTAFPPQSESAGCGTSAGKCCEVDDVDLTMFDAGDWGDDDLTDFNPRSDTKMVPKIYYGSRTHRQISQVVKELKKTVYRHKKMTVLSSREFTCLQETKKNKNELCAELLDPAKKKGCPYYNENNKRTLATYRGLAQNGVQSPWDIEDLVEAGRYVGACPYFAARALILEADIVFCPYNYLIDPTIREIMQLDMQGHVIILDEAHNIEDICRDAGSFSLTDSMLESLDTDCGSVLEHAALKQEVEKVAYAAMIGSYCTSLRKFIDTTALSQQQGNYDASTSERWTGVELIAKFEINQISRSTTENFIRSAREAISAFNLARENLRMGKSDHLPTLSTESIRKVELILMAFNMALVKHAMDYRIHVKQVYVGYKKEKSLDFMCMNPGVVFGPLSTMARSIILASGTLAPTSSFAGELGVKFPFMIQANHVTPPEQICIKVVAKGPNGKSLRATYQNINMWDFQDEVGRVLVTVCEAVPHGILIFFSSYTAMSTLMARWRTNKVMARVAQIKTVFQETRGNSELASMMADYHEVIRNTANGPVGGINGAILFAVFRGKVAEGIDFSDNEARAVLTIGIPFAVRTDPTIDMKWRYNDSNRSKGLLSGNEWYTIQAFRALNQALGRAIRHLNDWGAVILIDERLQEFRHLNLLPNWVRSMWIQQKGSKQELGNHLKDFVARQKKREEGNRES